MARKKSTVREHTRRVPVAWKEVNVSEHSREGRETSGDGDSTSTTRTTGSNNKNSNTGSTRIFKNPGIKTPGSSTGAEGTIIGCAVVVAAVWGFRTLYETGKNVGESKSSTAKELAGLTAHPAKPAQFLLGYGFVFFTLSVVSMGAPDLAKNMAILIAVGTTLTNGAMMFTDIGNAEASAVNTKGQATTALVTKNPVKVKVGENQVVRSKA